MKSDPEQTEPSEGEAGFIRRLTELSQAPKADAARRVAFLAELDRRLARHLQLVAAAITIDAAVSEPARHATTRRRRDVRLKVQYSAELPSTEYSGRD